MEKEQGFSRKRVAGLVVTVLGDVDYDYCAIL
jgi:hypothetical protein